MTGRSIRKKAIKKPKACRELRQRTYRGRPTLPPEPISKSAKQLKMERDLLDAAKKGNVKKAEVLPKRIVDVEDGSGWTPLMHAAANGHTEMVELLIEKGADVYAKNDNGATPLMYAAARGHVETVKLLIEKGADVNAMNNFGSTAMFMCRVNAPDAKEEIIKILKENGAKVRKSPKAK